LNSNLHNRSLDRNWQAGLDRGLKNQRSSTTFEEPAAAGAAAFAALQGLRDKGQVKPGQKVDSISVLTKSEEIIK
jgi:hypothetical protein